MLASTALDWTLHLARAFGSEIESSTGPVLDLGIVLPVAWLTTFFCWQFRVVKNGWTLNPGEMSVSPRWSLWSYLVPIANFWIPAKALVQSSCASGSSSAIVLFWWVSSWLILIAGVVHAFVASRSITFNSEGGVVETVGLMDSVIMATGLVTVCAEIVMIRALSRAQTQVSHDTHGDPDGPKT